MTEKLTTIPYKKLPPIEAQVYMFNENNLRTDEFKNRTRK